MEGLAYFLPAAILIAASAIWMQAHFQISRRRVIESGLLIAGCVALAVAMINDTSPPPMSSCGAAAGGCGSAGDAADVAANQGTASIPVIVDQRADSLTDAKSDPLKEIDKATAVYDITAHTVYLPNGAQLEAHSGLGDRLDNPLYVHEHMRGATPPSTYELIPRERPFHGVRALRLIPVGNPNIFGRKGLLAHTYMLGPKGHSNGCVVFRDYQAFLQAYDAGEIKRLLVVARFD